MSEKTKQLRCLYFTSSVVHSGNNPCFRLRPLLPRAALSFTYSTYRTAAFTRSLTRHSPSVTKRNHPLYFGHYLSVVASTLPHTFVLGPNNDPLTHPRGPPHTLRSRVPSSPSDLTGVFQPRSLASVAGQTRTRVRCPHASRHFRTLQRKQAECLGACPPRYFTNTETLSAVVDGEQQLVSPCSGTNCIDRAMRLYPFHCMRSTTVLRCVSRSVLNNNRSMALSQCFARSGSSYLYLSTQRPTVRRCPPPVTPVRAHSPSLRHAP